ncbi:MAG: phytanoyl-CoA dioxygenase family protein [bacterium]|nr:phytanoyl-CoA dioxygenase family protein [bacterium]
MAGSGLGAYAFEERGFAAPSRFCSVSDARTVAELLPATAVVGRTVVQALERDAIRDFEITETARDAVVAVHDREWGLAFAQWYCKPAASPHAVIPWHQDRAFWRPERGLTLTTWIALDDATEANGCVVVRPGSHLESTIREHVADPDSEVPSCSVAGTDESVAMELRAGMGFVYHERLIHRSGGNRTSQPRRALVLGWTVRR